MKISVLPLPVTPCKRFGLYILDLIAVFKLSIAISCSLLYSIFFLKDLNEVPSIALSWSLFLSSTRRFFSSALHIDMGFELITLNLETFMYFNGVSLMASKIKLCLGDKFL